MRREESIIQLERHKKGRVDMKDIERLIIEAEASRVYLCVDYSHGDKDFQVSFGDMVLRGPAGEEHFEFEARGTALGRTLQTAMNKAAKKYSAGRKESLKGIRKIIKGSGGTQG